MKWVPKCGALWRRPGRKCLKPSPMEINVEHPLLKRLDEEADEDRFADLAQILLDQAVLAEGSTLEDPASCRQTQCKLHW